MLVIAHSVRSRRVSNRYPLRVAETYYGDIARALQDADDVVAANVAAWERAHGLIPRDWYAIGAEEEERDEDRDR